jgi:hypothetical protein
LLKNALNLKNSLPERSAMTEFNIAYLIFRSRLAVLPSISQFIRRR